MTPDEWTDRRPQQGTLDVGQDAAATADRQPKIAGSARFADDRDRPEERDTGRQASLAPDEIDGQADLTGGPATIAPEWSEGGR